MSRTTDDAERERRYRELYSAVYADLLRFVQRRTAPGHAEDVVAEALLVVWRRFDDAPDEDGDARAWTFGIARNILLNAQRGERRREALGVRIADTAATAAEAEDDLTATRIDLARAWNRLSEVHQEALGLAVFEQLAAPQAAAVLGISPVAFRLRLSRARRALRLLLDHLPQPAGFPAGTGRNPS